MRFLDKILFNKEDDCFRYCLVLDIGTEYLKAALLEYRRDERNIIAFTRVKQDHGNMVGGAITNIGGVVEKAREALSKLKEISPHQTKHMVCGIAGEFVKGVLISLDKVREKPDRPIDDREIGQLIREGEKEARGKALKMTGMETGIGDVKIELIQTNIVEIKVDGYKVMDPCQFQGKNLNLTVFYTFVPLVQLGALNTVAGKLGCELAAVVPEPMAVAESILNAESREFGAIIIDIGGGTTDIALIRNGGIEGTRMFAMGGRAFTRSIAAELNLSLKEAEELKLAYSSGEKIRDYERIDKLIKADLHIIYQGIELSLMELARGEILPKRIFFCGGGSALKGLISGFRQLNPAGRLPFGQNPLIELLRGKDIKGIEDGYSLLEGVEHTTPRALAYCASKSLSDERRRMNIESQRL